MATAKSTISKTVKEPMQQGAETIEQMSAVGQERMREGVDRSIAAMSELGSFGKENVEAFIASATAASKGFEALSQRAAAYSKQAMENHVAATKNLMTSKSVQEFVERQSDYARSAFDGYVAEMNRMSDLMAGLTKDAMQPLSERMTAVGQMVQTNIKTGPMAR